MQILTLLAPDDFHVHLRDGPFLSRTVPDVARQFQRALIMPNLSPPVTQVAEALAYRERILQALPQGAHFEPLMTLYLTSESTPELVKAAAQDPHIHAFKLYPAGATTNSAAGLKSIQDHYPIFEALEAHDMSLAIHGEVTDPTIDVFDREAVFIEKELIPLRARFPQLKIILEHITTKEAVDYIMSEGERTAATITAHHLLYERNAIFTGGIRPHFYCLPILKRKGHQEALIAAATSGHPRFFLGTDSAPHAIEKKESACGCAGMYTAYSAMELYADVFDKAQALSKLEAFASHFGADFYGLPRNTQLITLEKKEWRLPESLSFGGQELKPVKAGEKLSWKHL
jgi:dihydroorotase